MIWGILTVRGHLAGLYPAFLRPRVFCRLFSAERPRRPDCSLLGPTSLEEQSGGLGCDG